MTALSMNLRTHNNIDKIVISSDSKFFVTCGGKDDNVAHVWTHTTYRRGKRMYSHCQELECSTGVVDIAIAPNSAVIATGSFGGADENGEVKIWEWKEADEADSPLWMGAFTCVKTIMDQ